MWPWSNQSQQRMSSRYMYIVTDLVGFTGTAIDGVVCMSGYGTGNPAGGV